MLCRTKSRTHVRAKLRYHTQRFFLRARRRLHISSSLCLSLPAYASVRSTVGASSAMQHIEGNYDRKAKLDAAISHSFPAFCSTLTPTRGAVGPSSAAISLRPADCPRIGRFTQAPGPVGFQGTPHRRRGAPAVRPIFLIRHHPLNRPHEPSNAISYSEMLQSLRGCRKFAYRTNADRRRARGR